MLNGDVGYAHGYDGKGAAVLQELYAGGIGSWRLPAEPVAADLGVSPRWALKTRAAMANTVTFQFPMPGTVFKSAAHQSMPGESGR